MTTTVGNASVNRTVSKISVGSGGVNKAVSKMHVGNGGVNRQVFSASLVSYGDGANNGVANAYTNLIYTGIPGSNSLYTGKDTYSISGNWYNMQHWWNVFSGKTLAYSVTPASGVNTVSFSIPVEAWSVIYFSGGSLTTAITLSAFYLNVGGSYYTLQQCVTNAYIYPLVLLGSDQQTGNYYFPSFETMYTAGTTGSGNYPWGGVIVKPKTAVLGYRFTTNKAWNAADKTGVYQITTAGYEFSLAAF
jgi:hypothetical protein